MAQERPEAGRVAPLSMTPEEFRAVGHECVEMIAGLLGDIAGRPITSGVAPSQARAAIGGGPLSFSVRGGTLGVGVGRRVALRVCRRWRGRGTEARDRHAREVPDRRHRQDPLYVHAG